MQNNREIIHQIKNLRSVKPREDWKTVNRALLLRQISQEEQVSKVSFTEYLFSVTGSVRQTLFQPVVVMLLVIGTFVGSSLVVNAAFYSLPDSTLYPVKIALERTQIAITPTKDKKVELSVEFARKRVEEFERVVAKANVNEQERNRHLSTVAKEFAYNVAAVKKEVDQLTVTADRNSPDVEKTLRIAVTVEQQAAELAKKLEPAASQEADEQTEEPATTDSALSTEVGSVIAEAVESAKQTSQSAKDLLNKEKAQDEQEETATSTDEVLEADTTDPAAEEPTDNLLDTETDETNVLGSATGTGETTAPLIE